MKFDKDKFLFIYQQEDFGTLNDHQRGGLLNLLFFIENDEKLKDLRHAAYLLATTKHETADTFLPIEEYGKGADKPYGKVIPETGKAYYGRGYVQLTWKEVYIELGSALRIDLYEHPELALVPEKAYAIMSYGMRQGAFTGVTLQKYIDSDHCDYKNARRIINGVDQADKIADYADKFEHILRESETTA